MSQIAAAATRAIITSIVERLETRRRLNTVIAVQKQSIMSDQQTN